MKYYTGENIRKVIKANTNKWLTTENDNYIIIYPAPALYLRPVIASKAIVFTKQLTTTPAKYPGGCFIAKQYTVNKDKNTLPNKYKEMLREAK